MIGRKARALKNSCLLTLPTAFAVALAAPPAEASVTTISSWAYALGVNLTAGDTTFAPGPLITAPGFSPSAFNVQDVLPSFSIPGLVTTGVLGASATSFFPPTPVGGASATITNLNISIGPFLDITATEITSSSMVNGFGTPTASGMTTIENLTISGPPIGAAPISVAGAPPPNFMIVDNHALGLEIMLNEQTPDLGHTAGITTHAVAIEFSRFPFGFNDINGGIDIGGSYASINGTVPEPATWAEMLAGFAALGFLMRGRCRSVGA